MAKKLGKEPCPACVSKGNDTTGDNAVCYDDGSKYCYACGWYLSTSGVQGMTYQLPISVRLPEQGIKTKGITRKTAERYGLIHVARVDEDGTPVTKQNEDGSHSYVGSGVIGFPYHDISTGELVGCKLRRFGSGKKEIWMDNGSDTKRTTFFGVNAIPSDAKTVVLCEGESDTLTVAQEFPGFAVLGVPGADATEKCIKSGLHVLKTFNRIVLAFDNDEAGQKATATALQLLPPAKTYVSTLPPSVKDWNELLLDSRNDEIKRCIRDAKQVTPKGVVDADELRSRVLDYLFNRDAARGASTGFASLDKATGGAAPGKLITIAGGTGSGKSTFAEAIAVNAATTSGTKTFFIPLEMTDSQVGARMVQQILRQPIASDPYFKVNSIPRIDIERAIDLVQECIKFFDHYGSIDISSLVETCEYAIDAYGVQLIVLDHLTAAASGSEGLDWKALDAASSELKRLALRRGVCIIVVSHISRDGDNEDNVPQLRHIRGGNGIAQYSDCVLGVGRKRDSNVLTVRTIKVDRMVGKFIEFTLKYEQCALIEEGEVTEISPDPINEDTSDDEWLESNEDREVQKQVRSDSGDDVSSGLEVRSSDAVLHQPVHAGLPTTQRDNGGNEGLLHGRGQSEDEESESFKPRNRLANVVPANVQQTSNKS